MMSSFIQPILRQDLLLPLPYRQPVVLVRLDRVEEPAVDHAVYFLCLMVWCWVPFNRDVW